jgi:hypothetical protein
MPKATDPLLTPEHQLAQIAAILARGVVRYARSRRHNETLVCEQGSPPSDGRRCFLHAGQSPTPRAYITDRSLSEVCSDAQGTGRISEGSQV